MPGCLPVATLGLWQISNPDCLQAMLTQAGQEIAELREEVKAEKGKCDIARSCHPTFNNPCSM